MPHQVHERKFGRKTPHRRAMLRNLTVSALRYERVKTTEAKAKEIRGFVDRMIELGKEGSLEARRTALSWLPEPVIVNKVFDDLAKRYADRAPSFVRTTRLAPRVGDNAPQMLIELVPGALETKPETEAEEKPRRRRLPFRRGEKKSEETTEEKKPAAKKTAARKTTRKKTTAKT